MIDVQPKDLPKWLKLFIKEWNVDSKSVEINIETPVDDNGKEHTGFFEVKITGRKKYNEW